MLTHSFLPFHLTPELGPLPLVYFLSPRLSPFSLALTTIHMALMYLYKTKTTLRVQLTIVRTAITKQTLQWGGEEKGTFIHFG